MNWPWNKERAELDREVAYHLETLADTFEAQGMSRQEAMARARREFGGVDQVKEEVLSAGRWNWAVQLAQDLRFGWRMMRKSPPASLAAVVSLALGIGATTSIYSFADAVLWRKLPVPAPEQMLEVYWESKARAEILRSSSGSNFKDGPMWVADFFSKPAFDAIRERCAGKAEVAAHIYPQSVSTSFHGNVTVARLRGVSENFFPVLQLQPVAGRLFDPSGGALEIVVAHRFWERHLGRSERVIGETLRVNNHPYRIAGVLPREFFGLAPGDEVELYTPIGQSPSLLAPDSWYQRGVNDPMRWWLQLVARRAPGVPVEEARAVMDAAFASSWSVQPKSPESTPRIRLVDASAGLGGMRRQLGDPARILLVLVLMVLIVACANIANLLLARAAEREKEVALRVSLGCGSGRLMRQFLTESLLIGLLGGVLSLGVALLTGRFMAGVLPQGVNAASLVAGWNLTSLAVTAAATLLTVLLFGLYPAWRASRTDASPALHEGSGSGGTLSRSRLLPARLLVLAQVALAVLLVTAAILYTGNLSEILGRDAGFDRTHALLFDLRPGELGYEGERLELFYREVEERLRAIPGVTAVGISRTRPMRGGGFHELIRVPGALKGVGAGVHHATAGFPEALGVRILAGRGFTPEDVRAGRRVAILSERLAADLQLSAPVGARIVCLNDEWEVIGVANHSSYSNLVRPMPVLYIPFEKGTRAATVLVRTAGNPLAIVGAAREAVRSLDRNVPLVDVYTMEQQIARTLQRERMFAWLCGSFGVLALVLCVVGLYGLMSHATARRTAEIGIRMALGATPPGVLRQVVADGLKLALAGMVLGVPVALYAASFAQKQRWLGEGPVPYWTLAAALAVLLISALLAVFGPALRAASIDPMRALRHG